MFNSILVTPRFGGQYSFYAYYVFRKEIKYPIILPNSWLVSLQLLFSEEKLNDKLEAFVATTIMEHIMRIKSNCFELKLETFK